MESPSLRVTSIAQEAASFLQIEGARRQVGIIPKV